MHGIYLIKVIRNLHGKIIDLYEYGAPTHPVVGEYIVFGDSEMLVNEVSHVLKCGRDGSGSYYSLYHVQITVD